MKILKHLAAAALCAAAVSQAGASDIQFSYDLAFDSPYLVGFGKTEHYDVAIRIKKAAYEGCKVTGFQVVLNNDENFVENTSGWLSVKLKTDAEGNNAPDVCTGEAVLANNVLKVKFAEPYTITADGVYVGYSFDVTGINYDSYHPVTVVDVDKTVIDGLYLRASESEKRWTNYALQHQCASTMRVALEGDFPAYAADLKLPESAFAAIRETLDAPATIYNYGSEPISSVTYSYTLGGKTVERTCPLDAELPNVIGGHSTVMLPVYPQAEAGEYPLTMKITGINGHTNERETEPAEMVADFVPFVPVNRPLVEEYTALWCGFCPRGFVALEEMGEEYGADFVALSYHNDDPMAFTTYYPSHVSGYPGSYINRAKEMDPSDLYKNWPLYRKPLAPASVRCDVEWVDAEKTMLKATATMTFIKDVAANAYRVGYALVQDGMSDPEWAQTNNFAGDTDNDRYQGEWWDIFTNGSVKLKGLTYNDVVIAYPEYGGVEGSLAQPVKALQNASHSYTFTLADVTGYDPETHPLVQNPDKLRVVAVLVDAATGRPVNCATSNYADGGLVRGVNDAAAAQVTSEVWYDMQGRRVANPGRGLYIRMTTCADGTTRSAKVMR